MSELITIEKSELQKLLEDVSRKMETVKIGYHLRKWFTINEVASMFGYSDSWVDKQIKLGRFETKRCKDCAVLISKRSIEEFPKR